MAELNKNGHGNDKMDRDCAHCGCVSVGADAFKEACLRKDGSVTLAFSCPRCGSSIAVSCEADAELAEKVQSLVAKTVAGLATSVEAYIEEVPADEAPDIPLETYNPAAMPAAPKRPAAPRDPKAGEREARPQKRELRINYLTTAPSSMMTYGVSLNARPPAQAAQATQADYEPTPEDEARLEYFHRQIEGLDTVDDAIDEIDWGYSPVDPDEPEAGSETGKNRS